MLRLNTFGGLVLQQDGQLHTGPASQRRRLALLAVVAAAGQRGASRDKLLALLWPDSDPEPARHSLYQAVHAIRRSGGNDEIFLGSTTLQLNTQLITSDVGEFEEAVESGAHEQAARLYRGPFLDGFRLENAKEYEEWQDSERVRHAREYAAALEALAAAAAARRDYPAAVRWWRRLAAAEPVSTSAAVGLIEALVAAGDRAGALQFAGVHSSLVRQHLEAEPDPEIEAWIGRLRSGEMPAQGAAAPPPPRTRVAADAETGREAAARELEEVKRGFAERYQVGDQTGESTLLLTFAARDRRDTRPVELHVLSPRLAGLGGDARVLEALERVVALRDPRIVPVREAGTLQGRTYFATPAGGGTLAARPARQGSAAAGRRSPRHRGRAAGRDGLRPWARRAPRRPASQARNAHPRAASRSRRSAWSRRSISPPPAAPAAPRSPSARRRTSRPSSSPARAPPTSAATSTASAASCSRCSRASRRSGAATSPWS